MKRKREAIEEKPQVSQDSTEKNVNKNATSLNLKSVCTITQPSELTSGFCLQATNEYVLLRSKSEVNVLKFEKTFGNHQSKFRLSSAKFPCSDFNILETLKVDGKKVFQNSNHSQKNDIMLDTHLNPHCVPNNFHVVKSLLSPSNIKQTPILASLSSHGSLELTEISYDEDNQENSREFIAELCETRKTQFSLGSTYVKLEKLQEIFKELSFRNFDWCPDFIASSRLIAAVTKNNELVIFSINEGREVSIEKDKKFEFVVSSLKWFLFKGKHFLVVGSSRGDFVRYEMKFSEGKIDSLEETEKVEGKLRIPFSNIEVDCYGDSILVIAAKAHSLEFFLITGSHVSSVAKYVGLSVTGIARSSLNHPHYLVTSMCNKVYFVDLAIASEELKISRFENIEYLENPEIIPSMYSAYGIATSKSKVLTFIALYPRVMFDHLTLKQPIVLSVNILSTTDPYDILLQNKSLKLTELYDCVEAARHIASNSLTSLEPLETMTFKIGLNEEFLYFLKLQLIVNDASMTYYQTRSETLFEMFKSTDRQVRMLIETINAYFLLKSITSRKEKHSTLVQTSIHCLKGFIESYLQEDFEKEPLKTSKETLTNELESFLTKCKLSSNFEVEQCKYCQEKIDGSLLCPNNHQLARCSITKLQLPLEPGNSCSNCHCCVMDVSTLKEIIQKEDFYCLFCDQQFKI